MNRGRPSRSTGGLIVTLLVGVLAVTAVLLAIFALRVPASPDAGKVPGPIPTWGATSTSNPTPAPAATNQPVAANPQYLSMYDGSLGIRATVGSCTGAPAVVQRTTDGGATWKPVAFDGADIRQVLGLDFVSETQINVIGAAADCVPTVVTSFTGGEFWQSYPEQIGTATFVQPTDSTRIRSSGTDLIAPCPVSELQSVGQSLVALCSDGTLRMLSTSTSSSTSWRTIGGEQVLAIGASSATSFVAVTADTSCSGVELRSVDISSGATSDLACVATSPTDATVDFASGSAFYWSDKSFLMSNDGGITWNPLG